jgi:hypothetical protein
MPKTSWNTAYPSLFARSLMLMEDLSRELRDEQRVTALEANALAG